MSTIYKRGGKKKRNGTYYIQYFDENGRRRTKRGCSDKDATERVAGKLEADVLLRKHGVIDARVHRYSNEARRPVSEHLKDWESNMRDRGVTEKQVRLNLYRVKRLFEAAGIGAFSDITPFKIQEALGLLRSEKRSLKTCNEYLCAAKTFGGWARRDGRVSENMLDSLSRFNAATDRRHIRRVLTEKEVGLLLSAAESGPVVQECSGPERALLYRVAIQTGLRKSEIDSLKVGSFHLNGTPPEVVVEAAYSKHRREDTLPLPEDLVDRLRVHLKGRSPEEPALAVPKKTERAMRKDLAAAGIPYKSAEGIADFHALRHTFVTRLVKAGVNLKTAQMLARHSDPKLTLGVYSHVNLAEQADALNALADLGGKQATEKTDDEEASDFAGESVGTYVGSCAAFSGPDEHRQAHDDSTEPLRKSNRNGRLKNEMHRPARRGTSPKMERETGFEPATFSLGNRWKTGTRVDAGGHLGHPPCQ
ncbi:site-specific integrase [bacterium]|nr:site-specific integrase [bacterium]